MMSRSTPSIVDGDMLVNDVIEDNAAAKAVITDIVVGHFVEDCVAVDEITVVWNNGVVAEDATGESTAIDVVVIRNESVRSVPGTAAANNVVARDVVVEDVAVHDAVVKDVAVQRAHVANLAVVDFVVKHVLADDVVAQDVVVQATIAQKAVVESAVVMELLVWELLVEDLVEAKAVVM